MTRPYVCVFPFFFHGFNDALLFGYGTAPLAQTTITSELEAKRA